MAIPSKRTLVIGASLNPLRYSHNCVEALVSSENQVVAIGLREGFIGNVPVHKGMPQIDDIHTVTLYIGPQNQPPFYQYIMDTKPLRVIFNPGTENPLFEKLLLAAGIKVVISCTLMMLEYGDF
jgi:uncharacterized protein